MKIKFTIFTVFIIFIFQVPFRAQNKILWGGGLTVHIPDNGFGKFDFGSSYNVGDDFGFATVANPGFGFNFGSLWFYNPRLSLQSELAYSYFPKDKQFWNVQRYGDISVNYQMLNLSAQGNYYFAEGEIRPYLGAVFGIYYLRNKMDFNSTSTASSSDYITNTLHAGYALEFGTSIELTKRTLVNIGLRYTIIPDISSEYTKDGSIKLNPHDKQNHWGLSAKLFFSR
ncbi:OmpW family outer membrane protein [Plebeiibacterium marinum]|uniref:Outer membrane protein beta-barrel domain-containing protein n=1 Tax=Plebeiibacterium marinum TaxID=2992111 RepID=A0AAE3MEF7_9BACT|nr:OmpW family outer membrane protein [Plebeiobacterium marinum]MCW3806097.1 hypothetical protein [Plebeiobacterium marinum]